MDEVCYDVGNEPNLQLLQGESFGHKTTTTDEGRDNYAEIVNYIRTKLSSASIRSSVLCLRGSVTLKGREPVENSVGAVVEDGKL